MLVKRDGRIPRSTLRVARSQMVEFVRPHAASGATLADETTSAATAGDLGGLTPRRTARLIGLEAPEIPLSPTVTGSSTASSRDE